MDKKYLVISRCEDEVHNRFYTKTELEKALNEDWANGYTFIDSMPCDFMEFPSWSVFIMLGDIIKPKAEKVVTKLVI